MLTAACRCRPHFLSTKTATGHLMITALIGVAGREFTSCNMFDIFVTYLHTSTEVVELGP